MARRKGKPGAWLVADDTSGFTVYNDRIGRDYWGNLTTIPLQRNLQEISRPLGDPFPVAFYNGPQYEQTTACDFEVGPIFIGKTTKPFLTNSAYYQTVNFYPGVGAAEIGCTFIVS